MNKNGLSLLEILVATMIFALVITGLASVFLAGKTHIRHSQSRISAAEFSKYVIDPLQMQVRQDQWTATSNCLSNTDNCTTETWTGQGGIVYTAITTTSAIATTLRKVTTNIQWSEPAP